MVKRGKSIRESKSSIKLKIKKISPKEVSYESKKSLEEKTETNEDISSEKFVEFLTPSAEIVETLASKKPRNTKPIEQDEEVLSFSPKEENKKEKKEVEYFPRTSRDYNLMSHEEEKKQNLPAASFSPKRVDFREVGREIRIQPREMFVPRNEMTGMAPSERSEERKYDIERVEFTEVGREKRYKLMK